MASVNKVILVEEYRNGASLTDLAKRFGLSISTVRYHVKKAGAMRSRAEGVRVAGDNGKLGSGFRGKTRAFSLEHRENIRRSRSAWSDKNAIGVSVKSSGYVEITRGPNKGRGEHVVRMEQRLGRRIRHDEHVHHIDGDRLNNDENNLALVTTSGHARLHRLQDSMMGKRRERNSDGKFR